MKPPTETLVGTIERYDEKRGVLHITLPYKDWPTMVRRGYSKCLVQLTDERPLSHAQRNCCFALIDAISNWSGLSKNEAKDYMKLKFLADDFENYGERLFSLSDAPMSLVVGFQRFLLDFILDNDIHCDFDLLSLIDEANIESYMYSCIVHKKCCICGSPYADLHHADHKVGIGRDRDTINHMGMPVESLCRGHHQLCHEMGQKSFDEKYHICSIPVDKTIATIYKLNTKERK